MFQDDDYEGIDDVLLQPIFPLEKLWSRIRPVSGMIIDKKIEIERFEVKSILVVRPGKGNVWISCEAHQPSVIKIGQFVQRRLMGKLVLKSEKKEEFVEDAP